ncbi:N-acetyltransferase family protein [Pontixanthobacter sp.]|uniref:GNAT family N-acetyltransferase n=1 Tax=Pontixanthobacter sp. TaxID=2792078 RepID=UPI003C7AA03B
MILRPAFLEDIPALAELGRTSFCEKFAHLYSDEDLARFLQQVYSVSGVTGDFHEPNFVYRLAEDTTGLIGYCKIAIESGYSEYSDAKRPMGLYQLYTAPGRTGEGIGAALTDWALAQAREHAADAVQLSVYSENYGAQRFYKRYGFQKIADIGFWVGQQRDAEFLYELRLNP